MTFSKQILEDGELVLQRFFPGQGPESSVIPPLSQHSEQMIFIRYLPPVIPTSSSSVQPELEKPQMIRIYGKKYRLHPDKELAIPVPPAKTNLDFKINNLTVKYPLEGLACQHPADLRQMSAPVPIQVQYLYQAEALDLTRNFPAVSAEMYPDLLLRLSMITQKPSKTLRWQLNP